MPLVASEGTALPAAAPARPAADCSLCPRLLAYRRANQAEHPGWFNGPVPSWGPVEAPLLIVGMAPGVRGANRTGRPFTGDHAGILLYETLLKFGFARGAYGASPGDGMVLERCRVVNAVRCVPPKNLPEPAEVRTCNDFLASELAAMTGLRVVLTLGVLSHGATVRALGLIPARVPFRHGALTEVPGGRVLADCYHVSRYNTNTGVLTTAMFEAVISTIDGLVQRLPDPPPATG